MRKLLIFISAILILANIYGCVAVLAGGAAGGAGTAIWLSGKLVRQVNASLEQTTKAVKLALQSSKRSIIIKETISEGIVQIRSRDINGEKVWVDIHRITDTTSQIQVRVGTFFSNKEAADRVLKMILQNL